MITLEHRSWVTLIPDVDEPDLSKILLHCRCGWAEVLASDLPLDLLNVLTDQHLAREYGRA